MDDWWRTSESLRREDINDIKRCWKATRWALLILSLTSASAAQPQPLGEETLLIDPRRWASLSTEQKT